MFIKIKNTRKGSENDENKVKNRSKEEILKSES